MEKEITNLMREDESDVSIAAYMQNADQKLANKIIAMPEGPDTRSNFKWFRLMNGDLILGVFPCGDTYLNTEHDRSI